MLKCDLLVDSKDLRATLLKLKKDDDFTILLDMTAVDYSKFPDSTPSRFAVVYVLRSSDFKKETTVKAFVSDETLSVDTVSDIFPSANWAEREAYDQYGVIFLNHPNLKRVLNHKQFVGHPLRKDYKITQGQICTETDDLMDEMLPLLKSKGYTDEEIADLMLLNVGPSHPASHGTIRNFVALEGETIAACVTEIGYLHRGFEKACEHHTYSQVIPYTDRLNYCSAILNNIGWAKAIEDMMKIEITPRAKMIRVVIGELSRIIDHFVCNAANMVDLGGLTSLWYLFGARDQAYDLLSKLTGARLTNTYTRIGGLEFDLYDGFDKDLEEVLKTSEKAIEDVLSLIAHNKLFHDRTQDVGVIKPDFALANGISGPNLRAAGVAHDLRKDKPYYGYENFDFDVVIGSHGDVYDRMMCRFEESIQSIKIIRQAMKNMPDGAINVYAPNLVLPNKKDVYGNIEGLMNQFKLTFEGTLVPKGEYYSSTEATNGELGFFIISDGSGRPYKVKCRPPCFYSLAAYSKIVEGTMLADAVVTMASLNFIAGEFDR
ncbi:NADH-quinone oxidoreductase subunit D [Aliarcobacter cryaerophilus]|jgi:NADH-quinone oxidoreductase subunit C/D|uniref:NADH-quinone oxidoreductase subunit D n=1 Tax=Arcobacter sp. AZ-2023 TaxID=3074453 RepID=A0AA96IFL4_9BACT|nr:NADH-quinone oxidoreductase subunit D [Aliarcobacter cryaerophilus]OQA76244.1 MAG: NADH-quinone oxidoreductase subunit C [Candidatus Dependentiae bacterium ADurb.Bin246]WNL30243.1 NADH-quinone oxidoreductase subunit D [Arcobacter sp. AZ-2023]MCT7463943.1 NADH-quinone oxidoreductase subunit D [Aliarcobacter cryaerophilus]MCT7470689.1 NADH-quinone oxidoreductase subunit D [Aliarcobacter cryaerophilus]MCT7472216.1 NADH-quinone oxidoreductase subunit D [Aliarcobacter cryaerophilus]